MREISPIILKDRHLDDFVDAQFIDGVTEQEISEAQEAWSRLLKKGKHEHAHWDWNAKFQNTMRATSVYRIFGIKAEDKMQGMLIAMTAGHTCRIEVQKNKPLIYIDYLASAPWNSSEVVESPKYAGIGKVLIRAAIQLSIDEEFDGRIGLHSLPQAESYYRDICGMTDMGLDQAYQSLPYFETTPAQSNKFMGR